MERLTERSLDYCTQLCSDEDAISCAFYKGEQEEKCWRANMYDRLTAYEDTGLEPEEVKEITSWSYGPFHKKMGDWLKAEHEGRLVVLPCKVGDFLYEIDLQEYGVIKCKVLSVDYYNGPLAHVPNNEMVELWSAGVEVVEGHGTGSCYAFEQTDFGKTVFLSREEAEKALKGDGKDE